MKFLKVSRIMIIPIIFPQIDTNNAREVFECTYTIDRQYTLKNAMYMQGNKFAVE